jgi:3-isopropylmalate dehydrogenase
MQKNIAILAGDGIGPEVMAEAIRVLDVVAQKYKHSFNYQPALVGGAAWDKHKNHFPDETKKICLQADAILFGSVGGPVDKQHEEKWQNCEAASILVIRKSFQFNINFRPVTVRADLANICPLKPELIKDGVDMLILRELVGDLYFGEHKTFTTEDGRRKAVDVAEYTEDQISSIAHAAFNAAKKRNNKVTSIDKANVLDTSKLWRKVVTEVHQDYPEVELEHMLVDNCAMQIVKNPAQFDVLLTSNMFGDILSDAASVLPGSLGLMPSASFNSDGFALYEPSGGSAPDIAGMGIANPIAQIESAAMMLKFSFGLVEEAKDVENAINKTLAAGYRTGDIYQEGTTKLNCKEITDKIIGRI